MKNLYMHLTNYAINKQSDKFMQNDGTYESDAEASKRSLISLFLRLEEEGHDVNYLK